MTSDNYIIFGKDLIHESTLFYVDGISNCITHDKGSARYKQAEENHDQQEKLSAPRTDN